VNSYLAEVFAASIVNSWYQHTCPRRQSGDGTTRRWRGSAWPVSKGLVSHSNTLALRRRATISQPPLIRLADGWLVAGSIEFARRSLPGARMKRR
jgi:hypothetical protein